MLTFAVSEEKNRWLRDRMETLNIQEKDIEEKFVRSSGHGGQNVNKTSTCVYLEHIPTGIEVKCMKDRRSTREDRVVGDYDKTACLEMHKELVKRRCYPCGICTKVCPIGKDRQLYKSKGIRKKCGKEREILAANPDAPEYKSWTHIRKYGAPQKPPGKSKDKE